MTDDSGMTETYRRWLRTQVPAHIADQLERRNGHQQPPLSPEAQQRHESIRRAVDGFSKPLRDAYRMGYLA